MTECALCGRALTVAAGEPVVCSDCEREIARDAEEIRRDREEEYDIEAYEPLDEGDEPDHGWVDDEDSGVEVARDAMHQSQSELLRRYEAVAAAVRRLQAHMRPVDKPGSSSGSEEGGGR